MVLTQSTDTVNNVERVELLGLEQGDRIAFVVEGKEVGHTLLSYNDARLPQRWALAVTGYFTGTLLTGWNPAWARPPRLQVGFEL